MYNMKGIFFLVDHYLSLRTAIESNLRKMHNIYLSLLFCI